MVTGCSGQVGRYLVQQAAIGGWTIASFDREQLDITDFVLVEQAVKKFKPDVIINAAAYTAVDKAESEVSHSYAANCDGPANLANAARVNGAVIIHISTDYVFSGDKAGPYAEGDLVCPLGVYGASKLAGEMAVSENCARHIILRTAWVFGEYGNNFVKTMLRIGSQRCHLGVVADQFGGPTYAGDAAAALLIMARYTLESGFEQWGIYHFSGAPYVSWHDFASTIFDKAVAQGLMANVPRVDSIISADYPTPARRPANSCLDCSRILSVFGITPSDWGAALSNLGPYMPA
ncbi:MAG: dTDP-4-dehydrorhamnose reductase [Gammaproteobacteria bacterium]|nr:dTDP-4-dehydrorhamnose reductase [Gammaproteobacteria bacterium]